MFGLFKGPYTPAIKDGNGQVKPNSIAVMEKVHLGGLEQWMVIRGHDRSNPLLVFLAGGPGSADWSTARKYFPQLEEHFTLVHWAPRGAIKSYNLGAPTESITLANIMSDLHELVLKVTARFGQKKVFVAGQSVGSMYSVLFAQQHPELVHAHIGINQVVHRAEEERIGYEFTLEQARTKGKAKFVADLERIGAPSGGMYAKIGDTLLQRRYLSTMGLVSYEPSRIMDWQKTLLFGAELSFREKLTVLKAIGKSMEVLWPELSRHDYFTQIPELKVPVFLVLGQHDHIVNTPLSLRWLEELRAPQKEAFVFEKSGHIACFEEPERFTRLMIEKVRPVAFQTPTQTKAG